MMCSPMLTGQRVTEARLQPGDQLITFLRRRMVGAPQLLDEPCTGDTGDLSRPAPMGLPQEGCVVRLAQVPAFALQALPDPYAVVQERRLHDWPGEAMNE